MGITTAADRKGKECHELSRDSSAKRNSRSRKGRRRQKKMLPIQRLYDTCREVFAESGTNIIPSPQDIERLRAVLDGIRPEDLGLTPDMPYFRTSVTQRHPTITYLHLCECDKFSMGIFCLPPSGVISLHDHPGMTVFSKLVFGTMHIKSYDWAVHDPNTSAANSSHTVPPGVRVAKVKVDSNFTAPCDTSILYPSEGGNMHCFTAVTACAVLDVLGPPYSDPDGRHCTYYHDYPFARFSVAGVSVPEEERDKYAWLEEREKPEELAVVGAMYGGPMFVEN
ncbi:plant cysteine oxidase 2-like [Syzygium oleosum]|uniref:plant cysteine oxidase 2-like n=1 Tax=Syzygium oleosum TaxID=219896 RepID=UPI0011D2A251|nr:plant cysteine oxidase 2-like [Syzygium oleosum]